MKKIFALILSIMLVAAISVPALAEDNSLQAVLDKGQFILGFDASFPPMGYVDDEGNYIGFDLDLAQAVCDKLGVELVLQPIDWDAKELELNGGNIDCIWNGMTATEDRAEAMSLSQSYLKNSQVVCVMDSSELITLADFEGKSVAVQTGSSGAEALEAAEDFSASLKEVVEFPDYAMALMDLENGNVDGVVIDIIVAQYYISKKDASYRTLDESLSAEEYAIGFRKDDITLTEKINQTLLEMVADGSMATISEDWFDKDITIIGK